MTHFKITILLTSFIVCTWILIASVEPDAPDWFRYGTVVNSTLLLLVLFRLEQIINYLKR